MIREDEQTEFKKTTGELNEALISISAILNKHGKGAVYFGMKNDGTPFHFTINDSTVRDVSRKIYESIKPQIFPTVEIQTIDGVEVIVVTFSGKESPYSANGKYYIRVADEDRELTPGELRRIMIGKEYEENWENRTSTDTIADVDEQTFLSFCRAGKDCGRLPELYIDKSTVLGMLGLLIGEHLTIAGRYLFSENGPILMQLAVFATDHKTTFLDIQQLQGNIFQLIDGAMNYIVRNIRWKVSLSDDGIHREETPEVPVWALREAVVNSLAHARYDIPVRHEIDIFSDRISIINPGSFANEFTPDDFAKRDLHSFLRNEIIARTLFMCKDVETFGSGIKRIYELCAEQHVDVFYSNSDTDFTIEFSRIDRNNTPLDGVKNDVLSPGEADVLAWLRENPQRTLKELTELSGKSQRSIDRIVASLRNKKLLERIGSKKAGYWKVP